MSIWNLTFRDEGGRPRGMRKEEKKEKEREREREKEEVQAFE